MEVAEQEQGKVLGGDTLVMLAYECRTCQIKLKEQTVEEVVVQEQVVVAPNPTVETLGKANDDEPPPSFFLLSLGTANPSELCRRIVCGNGISGRCDDGKG
jgi:hypothetical protein